MVAVDTVSAGYRERVLAVSGSSARMAEGCKDTPVDTAIVGIVDDVQPGLSHVPGPRGRLRLGDREELAALEGQRMLVVQPLTPELQATGKRLICPDCTGAGRGRDGLLGARQGSQLSVSAGRTAGRHHHRGHCRYHPCEAPGEGSGQRNPGTKARRC